MTDEPFNRHIEAARHSWQAVRERLRTSPAGPGREIAGQLDDIGTALDAAALEWAQQRDALAAIQSKIAEGARMEEAMRLGEGQLRGFFDASPAGMAVLDTELRYLRINERLAAINGQPVEAHLGKTVREVLPAFAPIIEPLCRQVLANGKPILDQELGRETTRAAGMDGDWIISYFPVPDLNGIPTALGAVVTDITTRKRAEEALRESEEKYRTVVENASEAITIAQDGVYVFANHRMSEILGVPAAILEGKPFIEFVWPEDREMVMANYRKRVAGEAIPGGYDFRIIGAGGRLTWISLSAARIQWKGRPATINLITDITDHKRAEGRIRDFSRKLLTVREEEKRSISAVLHHDLGSFTVGVTAYLNAVEEDLRKGKYREALASLKKARRLFVQSVRRLRKLAVELRPPDLDILGLSAALRQHFALLTDEAALRIRFTDATYGMTIAPEAQTVLFRVAQESLNNVVKHAHARQVRVRLSAPRKTFRLSIVDDGKGFDPVRAAAKSGAHLGLAVAREMVVALGGEFLVDAAPGRGTTVLVTVPPGRPKT